MKNLKWCRFFLTILVTLVSVSIFTGCDSASDVIDEATGNRAVKQYHRTTKKLDKIAEQQEERYGNIPDEEEEVEEDY